MNASMGIVSDSWQKRKNILPAQKSDSLGRHCVTERRCFRIKPLIPPSEAIGRRGRQDIKTQFMVSVPTENPVPATIEEPVYLEYEMQRNT